MLVAVTNREIVLSVVLCIVLVVVPGIVLSVVLAVVFVTVGTVVFDVVVVWLVVAFDDLADPPIGSVRRVISKSFPP